MLNRSAILLKYKQPIVDWINISDPSDSVGFTLEQVKDDPTIFLIDDYLPENLKKVLKKYYKRIFKLILYNWYEDKSLWPKKLTLELFHEWFDVICHCWVKDLGRSQIVDDG